MKLSKYKKIMIVISSLSLGSIITSNLLNNIINIKENKLLNIKYNREVQTNIIEDINNKDISIKDNNFILFKNIMDWKVRNYTTLWNNGGQKTLEYLNAFNINRDIDFKVDDNLLKKLVDEINNNINNFGLDINKQTKYIKSENNFVEETTKLNPKFDRVIGSSHIDNCYWRGYFKWKIYLLSSFKQIELTKNQIGGQYLMDYKFETNLLNDVEEFHIYNQGFDWQYFSGFDYTISVEKNLNNKKESNVSSSNFMIDIFSSKNSKNIIKTFLDINLPHMEKNPNNISGIWNKNDLIKDNYRSIFKFSDNLKLLKFINEYGKSNNHKLFGYDTELENLQMILIESSIIQKKNNNEIYSIDELGLLYERIISWFKNNEIIANISVDNSEGKDYVIWNGNSFLNEYDFLNTNSNKNSLNIKINYIESRLKSFKSKVIAGNSKISDAFGEYIIYYRNDFIEKNIDIKNSFNKCIPIKLDANVEDILVHDGENVLFVNNNDLANFINDVLNDEIEKDLFKNVELFDYLKHNFYNIDEVLKNFNIYENRKIINHKPNNDDGIFYVVARIPKWNTIDSVNNYNGNFNIENKINFIKNVNKNSINIGELISNIQDDTNGYFLLKIRTNKTNYIKNFNDYLNILNNFDKLFKVNYIEEKINNFFINFYNKKIKNIEIIDDVVIELITHEKINDEIKEKYIWTQIKNNIENLFNYSEFIFNKSNIEYKDEIDESIIKSKIDEIKTDIHFNEKVIRTTNIANIVILSFVILVTLGLAGIFVYRFWKNKCKDFQKNNNKKDV
ncbi:MAG: hypothetical protein ACRCUM_04270 [Mycoplasmoidaceae bacterium]